MAKASDLFALVQPQYLSGWPLGFPEGVTPSQTKRATVACLINGLSLSHNNPANSPPNVLREHCESVGRDYNDIVKTYGAEVVAIAETEAEARRIAAATPYQDNHPIIGTPDQVAEQLRPYIELGVEHIIVRCVDFPSTAGLELFSEAVIPQLSN